MSTPLLIPPKPYWFHLPRKVQELLAHYGVELPVLELYVMEDGQPVSSAEAVGTYVGEAVLDQRPTTPRSDWLEIVVRTTAHFARIQVQHPTED